MIPELEDNVNPAWADSIAKILKTNKPKRKKTLVLSKAKKITEVEIKKSLDFEVETVDGKIERPIIQQETKLQEIKEQIKKRKKDLNIRVKPNILEKDKERTLQKIATKGVVQLFNAVRMQQKDIDNKLKEAGPLDVRKEKVLRNIDKKHFLNVLMGEKLEETEANQQSSAKGSEKSQTWSVLRDDFMMGAKMKDWDKEMEDVDEEMEENIELESD